jgi:hypothetical protein
MDGQAREKDIEYKMAVSSATAESLESDIRGTPLNTIVEISYARIPDDGKAQEKCLGYYQGITETYWANGTCGDIPRRAVELALSDGKSCRIAIQLIRTFARYDAKTLYVLEQKPAPVPAQFSVPPSHHPKHNLKAERF